VLNGTGGGTLSVGSGSANVVDFGVLTTTQTNVTTVNLAGLDSFTANVGAFRVGTYALAAATGTVNVAVTLATNNTITASTGFTLGDNGGSASGMAGPVTLQFGSGTNTVTTPTMLVGGRKGPVGTGTQVTMAAGGTLNLSNGATGTGKTDLSIGDNNIGTATLAVGTLDLTGGTFIGTLGNVLIGRTVSGSANNTSATLTIGSSAANAVTADSVIVGTVVTSASTGTITNSTFNFGGGAFTVAGDVTIAQRTGGLAAGVANGTLNLTGGTFTVGGNLTTTSSANATAVVNLDGGALDLTAGTINVDTFTVKGGTLANVAQLQSGDGATAANLTKTTGGTLILEGTNTYSGQTIISAGTVQVGSGGTTGTLGAGNVANSGTLVFNRSNAQTVANVIIGAGDLVHNGTGTTTLTASSSYTGLTVINAGVLSVTSLADGGSNSGIGAATSAASNLVINDGATFSFTGAATSTDRLFTVGTGALGATLDGSGTGGVTFTNAGSIALGGLGTDSHTLTLTGASAPTVNNTIASKLTGNLSLIKDGTNTWTLTGDNDFTGGTLIKGGVLQVGNGTTAGMILNSAAGFVTINAGGTLAFNHSDDVTFDGTITGAGGVENRGTGGLILTHANDYNGITTVFTGSELTVTANGALGTSPAGTVVQDGGTLRLGVNYSISEDLTLNGAGRNGVGALTLAAGRSSASYAGPITIGSVGATITPTTTVPDAGTLVLNGGINLATNNTTVTFKGAGTVTLGGAITNPAGVTGNVAVDASTLNVNVASTYAGSTSVTNGGSIVSGFNDALPTSTALTIGTNASFDLNGHSQTLSGLASTGTGTQIVTNNGATASTLAVAAGSSTFGGTIQDGATSTTSLTVSGAATVLALTGSNTYTGGTTIDSGTVQINSAGSLGAASGVAVINAGTLQATADISTARNFQLGASTSTVLVDATKTYTVSGSFSGAGKLNQSGAGTLVLTGANSYTGGTNITGGTLQFGAGGATGTLPAGPVTTSLNATLALNHSNSVTVDNVISGGGNFTQAGSGTVIFTGSNTYSGTTTVSSGTLQVGNNDTTGSLGSGAVVNAGTLSFTRTDTTTIAGAISGSGTLEQRNGTLQLNGAVTGQSVHAISGRVNLGAGDTGGVNPSHALGMLTVDNASSVQLTLSGVEFVKASALNTAGSGYLDLTDNIFVLDYAGATEDPAQNAAVRGLLLSGFNGGFWNGPGINTSRATDFANNGTQNQYLTGIGYMSGAAVGGTYEGRAVDASSVITRYAYYGDADLNGLVNGADYVNLDSSYAALHDSDSGTTAAITWVNGDFNYDGKIDGADYALIDTAAAFSNGQTLSQSFIESREQQFGPSYDAGLASIQAVPEPASFGMLMLGGAMLALGRRRRAKTEKS
jgi:autotransporter-associated beta strand protein